MRAERVLRVLGAVAIGAVGLVTIGASPVEAVDGTWSELAGSASGDGLSTSPLRTDAIDVAASSTGAPYAIVTMDTGSTDDEVYFRRFDGSAWVGMAGSGTPDFVSTGSDNTSLTTPTLAVDADDAPHVAYAGVDGATSFIRYKYWDGSAFVGLGGSATGAGLLVGPSNFAEVDVAINPVSHQPYVLWSNTNDLMLRYWNGAAWVGLGASATPGTGIDADPYNVFSPSLSFMSDGTPLVVWDEQNGGAGTSTVRAKEWNGTAWVGPTTGTTTPDNVSGGTDLAGTPSLAIGDDTAYVAYQATNGSGIHVTRLTAAGWVNQLPPDTGPGLGASLPAGLHSEPAMAVSAAGQPFVAWDYDGTGGAAEDNVYAATFDGQAWSGLDDSFTSPGGLSHQNGSRRASIAVAADGTTFVGWLKDQGDATTSRAWLREFDPEDATAPATLAGDPPAAQLNVPYSFAFTRGGEPLPTVTVTSGDLPDGLTLSPAGVLSGTPTESGAFAFTATADNGVSPTAPRPTTIVVNAPPTLAGTLPAGSLGAPYAASLTVGGWPPPVVSVTGGALPPGLTISAGGVVSGTPTAAGSFAGTIGASNGIGSPATLPFLIAVTAAPTISGSAPAAQLGVSYTFSPTVMGSPTPTVTLDAGALPPGLDLAASGAITGIPTAVGTYELTLRAANGNGPDATLDVTIVVSAAAGISGTPPTAQTGVPYSFAFTVTGTPTPTVTLSSGALPPNMSINSTGLLGGTPGAAGTFDFEVTATNGVGSPATILRTLVVTAPPTIGGTPPDGTVGTAYTFGFTVTGTPAPTVTHDGGALPPGLALIGGALSGTPTTAGSFTFTLRAANGALPDATITRTIVVDEAPAITGTPTSPAHVGSPYTFAYTVTGSPVPTVALDPADPLPPGLGLAADGTISGTPTTAGTYEFTVRAVNGVTPDASITSTIVVDEAPALTGTPPSPARVGDAYSFGYTLSGAPAPSASTDPADLPPGLTLSPAGVLAGTPTDAGTYTFTVTATNGVGDDATIESTIVVQSIPTIAGTPTSPAVVGVPYSSAFTVTGSPTPTITTVDDLPPGLTLGSDGVLAGTPTAAGTYVFTVTATNAAGDASTGALTIVVQEVAGLTGTPPDAPLGAAYDFTYAVTGSPTPTITTVDDLPPGLVLDLDGRLHGTPTTTGTYTFTVTAANGVDADATVTSTVDVTQPASIGGAPPDGQAGTAYSFQFTVGGYPVPTLEVSAGDLPPGLTLSPAGLLAGTPTTAGTFAFTIGPTGGSAVPLVASGVPLALPGASVAISMVIAPGPAAQVRVDGPTTATVGVGQPTDPLLVTIVDEFGNPVPGVSVDVLIVAGDATLPGGGTTVTVVTDAAGRASVVVTAGPTPGTVVVSISAGSAPAATFTLTVTADPTVPPTTTPPTTTPPPPPTVAPTVPDAELPVTGGGGSLLPAGLALLAAGAALAAWARRRTRPA